MEKKTSKGCSICSEYDDDDPVHKNSPKHIFNYLLYQWVNKRKTLVKNRHGCEVHIAPVRENGRSFNYSENHNKGKHSIMMTPSDLSSFHNKINFSCKVSNIQKKSVLLTSIKLLHPYIFYALEDHDGLLENGNILELLPGAEYKVTVKFASQRSNLVGTYKIPVCFGFQTIGKDQRAFTIVRFINVVITENLQNELEVFEGKSPFTSNDWQKDVTIIGPERSPGVSDQYSIPERLVKFLKYGLEEFQSISSDEYRILLDLKKTLGSGHVTPENYNEFWHIVLWIEEVGQSVGLQRYNMENVHLRLNGRKLELDVPGLAEKRPSVIVGDFIDIRIHNDHYAYRGVIRHVEDKTIHIENVDSQLINYVKKNRDVLKEMDVKFVLGRLHYERMHSAVEQIEKNGMIPIFFPEPSLALRVRPSHTFKLVETEYFNRSVYTNPEQKTAVLNILNGCAGNAPYIVFGPPGTGKTVTIVEAILQIKKKTTKKILVCAPANAACNLLADKLLPYCKKNELFRIMSQTVDASLVSKNVLDQSNYIGDGERHDFRKIQAVELMKYRIVISTLIHIGKFMRQYHPDVVFVDEAAQACEPEADCAIAMLAKENKKSQIILAGDPHQLGPTLSSKVSEKYGLAISLLERLMKLDLYKSRNPNFITKLLQNFRSHSMILKIPNEMFYAGELQPMSTSSENDPLAKIFVFDKIEGKSYQKIKAKSFGQAIEFCSVLSKERREGRSPSYYNEKEMIMVLKYIQALTSLSFEKDHYRVKPEQIGIVTPYIRQVYKVKDILKRNSIEGVEVGTTETFQGREKRVIIVTTVRAQKDLLLFDKKYKLGFVKNEKRFNVAITRAMSKLIVIGCAQVLDTDDKWSNYINLCKQLNSFFGAPYVKRDKELIDDISDRFSNIKLKDFE